MGAKQLDLEWARMSVADRHKLLREHPQLVVGRKVEVKWHEGWFKGVVTQWNAARGEHIVEYDDGTLGRYNLRQKKWKGSTIRQLDR